MSYVEARAAAENHLAAAQQIVETLAVDSDDRQFARLVIEVVSSVVSALLYVGDQIGEQRADLRERGRR